MYRHMHHKARAGAAVGVMDSDQGVYNGHEAPHSVGQHWVCEDKRGKWETRHQGSSLAFPWSDANSKESKNAKLEHRCYKDLCVKLGGERILFDS